jgi:DMSO/TMAO reductase YedYZ heme-binding membrane subunit
MSATAIPIGYLLFVAGISTAIWTTAEPGPEEVRAVIRATAFTSAVPFLVVFVTSTAHSFLRSATTRWLMANRRYLGLSVAASHFWHLVAIVALIRWYGGGEPIATTTIVFGGGGFVVLGLMAATSNDASQRFLGPLWTGLHKLGLWVLWIDFIFTYSGTATISPFHAVMTVLFALAWMARVAAFFAPTRDAGRVPPVTA